MDPTANLAEQLELSEDLYVVSSDEWDQLSAERKEELLDKSARLAELILALDEWMKGGGYASSVE